MRKLTILLTALAFCNVGCDTPTKISATGDILIISEIKDFGTTDQNKPPVGRYKYSFSDRNDFYFFTDSVYRIGDTIRFSNKRIK